MKTIRPLIIQKLDLSMPGAMVHQVRIHRHLPQAKTFRSHRHRFSQMIVYLSGGGHQSIDQKIYPIRPGALFWIPQKIEHSFRELGNRKPLCLIIDIELEQKISNQVRYQVLASDLLHRLKGSLSQLSRIYQKKLPFESFKINAVVLDLLYLLLCSSYQTQEPKTQQESEIVRRVRQLIRSGPYGAYSLERMAKTIGYQKDYLNRILKKESGLTLGQIESQEFLLLSKSLFQREKRVFMIAEKLGFPDQNYFARWFRKQLGISPTQWMDRHSKTFVNE